MFVRFLMCKLEMLKQIYLFLTCLDTFIEIVQFQNKKTTIVFLFYGSRCSKLRA